MSTPRLVRLERVDSTQDVLHALAAEGAPAGTVVAAGEQLGGRGRRGRGWSSPPGGAWLSVLFRPPRGAMVELLSLRVGLAVADGLDALVGAPNTMLKWPNDLMLADRKLGGVLCEARWQGDVPAWVAAGVGINVTNVPPADARIPGARLAEIAAGVSVEAVVDAVVASVRRVETAPAVLTEAELAGYRARDWLAGRALVEPRAGVAAGVDASGALLVRTGGGLERVRAGTVVPASVITLPV